jgi:hypothetical protein
MTNSVVSEKVPFAIVHKEFDDDVLIANMRGLLPSWVPARIIDEPGLSDLDRDLLSRVYCVERVGESSGERMLGLCSVPATVTAECMAELGKEPMESAARHYQLQDDVWLLRSEFIDEMDHVVLMSHFSDRAMHLSDDDRFAISRALDKVSWLSRPQVSCFNMVMDTTNYFFYRKHHEHVPGMMLIEVVRQAMYAQYYRYNPLAKGQVSLTIENLNVNFMGFVNANYPLRIQVEDQRLAERIASDTAEERVATFSQLGRVVAVTTMRANPIKMNLFKRLRNVKPSPQARFLPRKNIAPMGMFESAQEPALEGRIHDVSMGGLKVCFDESCRMEPGAQTRFSMFVEGVGYITAKTEARWVQAKGSRRVIGMQIAEMDAASTARLRDAIKNFTFVDTRRGEC